MGSIKNVVSEPIEGHEDYHMMVTVLAATCMSDLISFMTDQKCQQKTVYMYVMSLSKAKRLVWKKVKEQIREFI